MAPSLDIRLTIRPRLVADGKIDNPQIQLGCAKKQIEIAKWIEVAKVRAIP